MPCDLVPIRENQEIELSRELIVSTHAMKHSIPALGFIVWERRKKLKPEYQDFSGEQIRDIKLKGAEVTFETRIPLVAYTGDTAPEGLDRNPDMLRAKVLITEMTFLAPDQFKNDLIICGHFSVRYNAKQIQRWVDRALPDRLDGRLKLWI
jgi:ribonuclease Z